MRGKKRVDKFNVLACVTKVRYFVFRTTYIPPVLMFEEFYCRVSYLNLNLR